MKSINNLTAHLSRMKSLYLALFFFVGVLSSCEDELPGEGSIPDLTPPKAGFSFKANTQNFKEINFTNLSISSLNYSWDFGDGSEISTEEHPSHVYPGEGPYTATLSVSDGNNITDVMSTTVEVVDLLIPEFVCPSFECDSRKVWAGDEDSRRAEGLDYASSPYSGSGSPEPTDGVSGAKIGAGSTSQYLDQTIQVSDATKYMITFDYASKSGGSHAGKLKITDAEGGSVYIDEQVPMTESNVYGPSKQYTFTTKSESLRFQMASGDVEVRFDNVKITKL